VAQWVGEDGIPTLLWAAGAAFVGAAAGRLPRLWIPADRPEAPAQAVLAGFGARMVVTAAIAFAILALALPPRVPFALSVVGLYLALLLLEVREAVREVVAAAPVASTSREAAAR
jgi:hypothetical protein